MITFPNAKINLGLNITEKRPDGYHNLETVFYPVPLEDALEITILNDSKQKFALHQSGLEISGEPENNLVVKAYLLLDREFQLPPIDIYLYKHIPSGAGLGGGSADAAFMLKLLNEKFHLHFFYTKQTNFRRRYRKCLFPCRFITERVSVSTCKTRYLCLDAGSFFIH